MVSAQFRGADTHQLRALAQQLHAASEQLTGMATTTTRTLRQTQWYGPDADQFRADWSASWNPRITAVAAVVAAAGTALVGQADRQDAASVADWPEGRSDTAVGPAAAKSAWQTWSDWYGRLSAAHGLMPYVATAIAWPDAPRVGPKTWSALAEDWSRVHLPTAALGRTLGVLNVAGVASDGAQAIVAASDGDAAGALEHGIPAAFGAMAAAPFPAVKLVGLAGSAGWTVGSWIQEPINNSSAGIWMGDHIVGPTGDAIVGAWQWLGRQVSGSGTGR